VEDDEPGWLVEDAVSMEETPTAEAQAKAVLAAMANKAVNNMF